MEHLSANIEIKKRATDHFSDYESEMDGEQDLIVSQVDRSSIAE